MAKKDSSLNRIYQGRVTALAIEIAKNQWENQPAYENSLWDFHALFQDAVNYYLTALIGMASDETTPAGKVRRQIETGGPESVWESFRRKGVMRSGLRDSVQKYLGFGSANPSFEEVVAKIFEGNGADAAVRNAAIAYLLGKCDGDGAIQQNGRTYWPLFCDPKSKANSPCDPLLTKRDADIEILPFVIHQFPPNFSELATFDAYSVATPELIEGVPVVIPNHESKARLMDAIGHWKDSLSAEDNHRLVSAVQKLSETFILTEYRTGGAGGALKKARVFALMLFKYLEQSECTLSLLKKAFAVPKSATRPNANTSGVKGDPITACRGKRGYAFASFTGLINGTPDTPGWKDFDIVAFKEALKALNQINQKGDEREKKRQTLEAIRAYMRTPEKKWDTSLGENEESAVPPKLTGDPRIARLEEILTGDLAYQYEATEGESVEYGLRPRTIRGFETLAEKWNKEAARQHTDDSLITKLREILHKYQQEESDTVGSVVLFDALLSDTKNHLIWRTPTSEEMTAWRKAAKIPADAVFSENPVKTLTDEREMLREIKELEKPIRLTPANAFHSPRQVLLSEAGECKHIAAAATDGAVLRFTTHIAFRNAAGIWEKKRVRVTYSAPRLLRDELRSRADENLTAMPWCQPMMAALGMSGPVPQDFSDCAVNLMPVARDATSEKRILLNFPLSVNPARLIRSLGTADRWRGMFCPGFDREPAWLHWPSSLDSKKEASAWWVQKKSFQTLSVDLGTRDAAAFAVLTAMPEKPAGFSRHLGDADDTAWFSSLGSSGILRLPGEDARVLREGKWQEELYGEKGRSASAVESREAVEICAALGIEPLSLFGENPGRLSFPEQNDKLLVALRRAQSRLARLQSWSALEHKDTKAPRRARIREEIKESTDLEESVRHLFASGDTTTGLSQINRLAGGLREAITTQLLRVADRILPARGRRWEWCSHPGSTGSHILRLTLPDTDARPKLLAGQRGISLERIGQLEELRHRAQSLNRALMHRLGEPAAFGRRTRDLEIPDPCPEVLEKLDAIKEQRVKQTAHLILAQALGLRLRPHAIDESERVRRDIHGEYEKIPGRTPVDFIVMENLDRYLADQGRGRAENTRLMQWSHRDIVSRVRQLAEPYGIPVLTTPAAYTSRFCSRTGEAGFRAVELHPGNRHDFPWRKDLEKHAKVESGELVVEGDERARLTRVFELFRDLDELNRGLVHKDPKRPKWKTLIAPRAGGPVFVAAGSIRAMQADINAAINIGLRAIAAPDNALIHHRIRAKKTAKGDYDARADNAREKARWKRVESKCITFTDTAAKVPSETFANFFHDAGGVATFEKATLAGTKLRLASNKGLWSSVKRSAWTTCSYINKDRLLKAEPDLPM